MTAWRRASWLLNRCATSVETATAHSSNMISPPGQEIRGSMSEQSAALTQSPPFAFTFSSEIRYKSKASEHTASVLFWSEPDADASSGCVLALQPTSTNITGKPEPMRI
jgi:hypothetical protein